MEQKVHRITRFSVEQALRIALYRVDRTLLSYLQLAILCRGFAWSGGMLGDGETIVWCMLSQHSFN